MTHPDPWHDRHPQWARHEAEEIARAERAMLLRLQLGFVTFGLVAFVLLVLALRDHLPAGW